MNVINIENEEQLKELFKTGVRVGEKSASETVKVIEN